MPPKKLLAKNTNSIAAMAAESLRKKNEMLQKKLEEEALLAKLQKEAEERALEEERQREQAQKLKEQQQKQKQELVRRGLALSSKQQEYVNKVRKRLENQQDITKRQDTTKKQDATQKPDPALVEHDIKVNSKLRSPIVCILGSVDAGKTKLLDCIFNTQIQAKEAGLITQQIGSRLITREQLEHKWHDVKIDDIILPGLLFIDTPGHQSFSNLRSRGNNLCDIVILIVDIMHGIQNNDTAKPKANGDMQNAEPSGIEAEFIQTQTKTHETPFMIVLNKIDRIYGWNPDLPIEKQSANYLAEFKKLCEQVQVQFAELGLNAKLYTDISDGDQDYTPMIPISAKSGHGVPFLLYAISARMQTFHTDRLVKGTSAHLSSVPLKCTVLEVNKIEGMGTVIDVILVDGTLQEGDDIIICGLYGPIRTKIRAILESGSTRSKTVEGSIGVRIQAPDLGEAVAGSQVLKVLPDSNIDQLSKQVQEPISSMQLKSKGTEHNGIYLAASTLGSLEALYTLLQSKGINVSQFSIGRVHKKHIINSSLIKMDGQSYLLAFNVDIDQNIRELAAANGVTIFEGDVIYQLCDKFIKHIDLLFETSKQKELTNMVFPCILQPLKCFRAKNPILVGVRVLYGQLRVGTPLCIIKSPDANTSVKGLAKARSAADIVAIGYVSSIERDSKTMECGQVGDEVAIKIETKESSMTFGKICDIPDLLLSHITRESLDVLKKYFAKELNDDDIKTAFILKSSLQVT